MSEAILFFVKYPEPGKVKTRLAATVGPEEATAIYRQLVKAVCDRLPQDVEVWVYFDPAEMTAEVMEWMEPLMGDREVQYLAQPEGDLGERLERGFATLLAAGAEKVAAIGSDCVELKPDLFEEAWRGLEEAEVVIGPSEDGGYYLLALREAIPSLFRQIPWSTEQTFAATVAAAEQERLGIYILRKLRDVDTEEDWTIARRLLGS